MVNTSDVVTTGKMESVSFSLIFNLHSRDFVTSQYEGGPGGGGWALLGDNVEKRVPKVDESMVVKGEKNVMHPTSTSPAFLKICECL